MQDCIFCKIANGEFNTEFVYKTDDIVVFRDINPKAPIHLLVVPKKHYKDLNDIDNSEVLKKLLEVVLAVTKQEKIESYRTVINTGKDAGQEVFHVHVHILAGKKMGDL